MLLSADDGLPGTRTQVCAPTVLGENCTSNGSSPLLYITGSGDLASKDCTAGYQVTGPGLQPLAARVATSTANEDAAIYITCQGTAAEDNAIAAVDEGIAKRDWAIVSKLTIQYEEELINRGAKQPGGGSGGSGSGGGSGGAGKAPTPITCGINCRPRAPIHPEPGPACTTEHVPTCNTTSGGNPPPPGGGGDGGDQSPGNSDGGAQPPGDGACSEPSEGDEGEETAAPEEEDEEAPAPKVLTRPGGIANATGYSTKQIKTAIHAVKNGSGWRGVGSKKNSDVGVDPETGEVYPPTSDGGWGDSIGNIYDYLPEDC